MTSAGRTATNSEATGSATLTASMGTRQDSGGDECPFCLIAAGRTDTEVLLSVSVDRPVAFHSFNARSSWFFLTLTLTLTLPLPAARLQDDELLCFCDVKPGAAHHYLVVTAMHIDSCKALRREHVALGEAASDCLGLCASHADRSKVSRVRRVGLIAGKSSRTVQSQYINIPTFFPIDSLNSSVLNGTGVLTLQKDVIVAVTSFFGGDYTVLVN